MTFREDGEGLKDRAEDLDHEVIMAKKALEDARGRRIDLLEQELMEAQQQLSRMRASLDALRDAPPPAPERRLPVAPLANLARAMPVLLPVGMVAMLGFAVGHNSARKVPCGVMAKRPVAAVQAKMTSSASTMGMSTGSEAEVSTRLRWPAKVRSSSGMALPVGTECRIEGRFVSQGARLVRSDVEVWCGDKMVYEKGVFTAPDTAVSIDEFKTPSGAYLYNLDLEDVSRPGLDKRSMASIDTEARVAVISRDVSPMFRLELDVEPVSTPVASSGPLFPVQGEGEGITRAVHAARVVHTSGAAPVSAGDQCTVSVIAATPRSGWSCRTFIRCGDKALYGEQRTGYTDCSGDVAQIRDLGYSLEDGDPHLEADLARGRVTLTENDTVTWGVELRLEDSVRR
jgi:hypothetical protein